jgi:integrase
MARPLRSAPPQWAHNIDFKNGEVRLWLSKNDEPRVFPFRLLPELGDLLRAQRQRVTAIEKATSQIIPSVWVRDDGSVIKSIRSNWDTACEKAGCPETIGHDFSRTAVRNLENAGVPRSTAMKLTGHKTEAIYRRYAIVSKADLDLTVGKSGRAP